MIWLANNNWIIEVKRERNENTHTKQTNKWKKNVNEAKKVDISKCNEHNTKTKTKKQQEKNPFHSYLWLFLSSTSANI